jgi:hypothetical protein
MFQRAQRKKARLRLALCGTSGSGKTYSALLVAFGLGGKVAMIDTERGSGELYSHLGEYDVCRIEPPFLPEKYVKAIHEAESLGYDTIIIDSLSHAWAGSGGLLEEVDKRKGRGNDFAAWRDVTPMHNALVDAMLQSTSHIIATMRSKTAYDMVKDEKTGKVKPVKVGLAPVQRDGMEYEFTAVLDLDVDRHVASASKDRTGLFDGKVVIPDAQTGRDLAAWLDQGAPVPPPPPPPPPFDLAALATELDGLAMPAVRAKWDENAAGYRALPEYRQITGVYQARIDVLTQQAGAMAKQDQKREADNAAPAPATDAQIKRLQALYSKTPREARLADASSFFGREVTSFKTLTKSEASELIEAKGGQKFPESSDQMDQVPF